MTRIKVIERFLDYYEGSEYLFSILDELGGDNGSGEESGC